MAALVLAALLLTAAAASASRPAELRFSATGRADAKLLLVRRGAELELRRSATGFLLVRRPLAGTTAVSVIGADGRVDNTLTVDLSGGPIGVPGGIRYDGGHGGYNTLTIRGGSAAGETSTPSGPHSGMLAVGATRIRYSDIAPVNDTITSSSYTFNTFATGPISVTNGGLVSGLQTLQISSATGAFELAKIANKAAITLDGDSGANAFTINFTVAPTGLTGALTIGGSAIGSNTASFAAIPAGTTVAYTGATGDAVTIGAGSGLQSVAGTLSVGFAAGGGGSLTLNDAGDTTGRTAVVGPSQVTGLTPNAISYTNASHLALLGGSGSDTFDVTPSATTVDSIAGGGPAPPAFPGDQLKLELAGTSTPQLFGSSGAGGAQGAWVFADRLPVTFSAMDSLDPTAASISDATVNPGAAALAPATFMVSLLAPDPNPVQIPYATADGSAVAAAGNYQAASGVLGFAPGQTSQAVNVNVPGTAVPGPTRTFSVNLAASGNLQLLRSQGIGTILDTATLPTPAISSLKQSASTWRLGSRLATIAAARKPPVGTTFSFTLNAQAGVTLSFTRLTPGRTVGGRCVAQSNANRRRKSCTRSASAGSFSLAGHQGADSIHFEGRLSATKKLTPGRYAVSLTAANAQGGSTPALLSFTVTR